MTQCMPSVWLVTCLALLLLVSSGVMQCVSCKVPVPPSRMVRRILHKRGWLRHKMPAGLPEVSMDHLGAWFLSCPFFIRLLAIPHTTSLVPGRSHIGFVSRTETSSHAVICLCSISRYIIMTQCMPSVWLVTCLALLLLVSSGVMQCVSCKVPVPPSRMVRRILHKRGWLRHKMPAPPQR
jgi:hypothetical protein